MDNSNYLNSIASDPFVYPEEDIEETDLISTPEISEFITRFTIYLVHCHNPKVALCALLYATNYDVGNLLMCLNNMADIAGKLGITKQGFRKAVLKAKKEYNIQYTRIRRGYERDKTIINNLKKKT
jgi:hypothetical protein